MGSIDRSFALILILIMAISSVSLLIVKPASAQSIPLNVISNFGGPAPSIPQFTVKFIPNFTNTTTTNPYTGANTTTTQNQSTIELTIINQQYNYSNGSTFYIYYNVRIKGHFEDSWTELYPTVLRFINDSLYYQAVYIYAEYYSYDEGNLGNPALPQSSNSNYTETAIPATTYPLNGQVDIQVEAMLGVNSTYYVESNTPPLGNYYPAIAYVTSSGWSNTQTVTISASSSSTSPTPTVPEFPALTILPLILILPLVSAILRKRRVWQ